MGKKSETAVAVKEETAVAVASQIDFMADIGAGMEGADAQSFAIPFLTALQKISPQCDEADAKYVADAKGGQLFNSVTGKLYDGKTGVHFLQSAYQRRFLRWGPRGGEGAGFKGEVTVEAMAELQESGKIVEHDGRLYFPLEDGTVNDKKCDRLADVRNHFGILIDPETGEFTQVLLSLGSTQIKKSKLLMSLFSGRKVNAGGRMVTPPTWFSRVKITTVPESNDKGSWYGYKFELDGDCENADHYNAAKEFHAAIAGGAIAPINYENSGAAPVNDPDDNEKF